MNHDLTRPILANLTSRVRNGARRADLSAKIRPYDQNVKFISLKNSMNLRSIVKARPPMGG